MAPRKTILRELTRSYEQQGADTFTRPSELDGFSSDPDRFQRAVNDLLKDRYINGRKDGDGRMAVALNGHRLGDIRKELRPVWAHPALWAVVGVAVVAVAMVTFGFGAAPGS